jgi:hypothetical protein
VPSIHLTPAERQDLLAHDRRSADPEVRLRSHILLLLDAGHPWATVGAVLFCTATTISRWNRRFEAEGVDAVFGRPSKPEAVRHPHLGDAGGSVGADVLRDRLPVLPPGRAAATPG